MKLILKMQVRKTVPPLRRGGRGAGTTNLALILRRSVGKQGIDGVHVGEAPSALEKPEDQGEISPKYL